MFLYNNGYSLEGELSTQKRTPHRFFPRQATRRIDTMIPTLPPKADENKKKPVFTVLLGGLLAEETESLYFPYQTRSSISCGVHRQHPIA